MRPSWSWGFEVVADAMKKRAHALGALDAVAQRRAWSTMTAPAPILRRVQRRDGTLAGLRCAWFEPKSGAKSATTILYLHGGSYVFGSIDTHAEVCGRIALATSCKLVSIEYRLAPEHPFPAQLEDLGRAGGRQLVEPVDAVDDQDVLGAVRGEHGQHPLRHRRVGHTDHHAAHPARVGQRAQDVEGGRDAELAAGRSGVAQRGVEPGREAEPDPRSGHAAGHTFG